MNILRYSNPTDPEGRLPNRRLGHSRSNRVSAVITAAAALAATGCAATSNTSTAGRKSPGISATAKPSPHTAHNTNPPNSAYPGRWETAEWSAQIFADPDMSAVIGRTAVGNRYLVLCRIPPNPDQPGSVSNGGWYELAGTDRMPDGGTVAANTFDNGRLPNENPNDPRVQPCEVT